MKKYIVVGNPIDHSLSPEIHNYWFKKNSINANYEKKLLNKEDIPKIISQLKNNKLNGINVTVPFKNDFISYVDELSDEARQTNSVNTIYKIENKLIGHNTDIAGFELAIRHCKFNANNKKALIIGAGGVVPSIIVALKRIGVEKIFLKNRTVENTKNLKVLYPEINIINWEDIINVDMIINATSVGLNKGEKLDIDIKNFGKNKFFYDVIYSPKETEFLKDAKSFGNMVENGKMMFIYQAHQAFSVWHKILPEIDNEVIKIIEK